MTRLIDADELLDWSEIIPLTDDGGIDINDFEEKLKTMPTIDAVPVIRCKDCRYDHECKHEMIRKSKGGGVIYCPVEFCSEGKRKDNAADKRRR